MKPTKTPIKYHLEVRLECPRCFRLFGETSRTYRAAKMPPAKTVIQCTEEACPKCDTLLEETRRAWPAR
jgi:hypothetical protein